MYGCVMWYAVYDGNDKVYEGTNKDIGVHFNVSPNGINTYARLKTKMLRKHSVIPLGIVDIDEANKLKGIIREEKKKKLSKEQLMYETIRNSIRIHGNTISVKEPTEILERLRQDGYECTARIVYDIDSNVPTANEKIKRKGRVEHYWVLERCKEKK